MYNLFAPRTVFGSMLLVAGSCIGAGMLALPIITGIGGFFSSIVLMVVCWIFMTATGLLILEVSGWFAERANIVSMAGKSFGIFGKAISWLLYIFLFYSLLVAYIAGSGDVLSSALHQFSIKLSPHTVGFLCMLFVGAAVFNGTGAVDFFNRIFMTGLVITYLGLIFLGLKKIHFQNLTHFNLEFSFFSFPILIASFSYHNIIPSIVAYLNHDLQKVRLSIIGGTTITLVFYILWQLVVLGILSFENIFSSYARGIESSQLLVKFLKSSWTAFFIQWFAFFAIITSFLIQTTGFMHFIADGLSIFPSKRSNWWLLIITLFPPFMFSLKIPHVFFRALSFAGGFCSILLFCFIPACMVWRGRFVRKEHSDYQLKGGKTVLLLIMGFSFFILFQELFRIFGF